MQGLICSCVFGSRTWCAVVPGTRSYASAVQPAIARVRITLCRSEAVCSSSAVVLRAHVSPPPQAYGAPGAWGQEEACRRRGRRGRRAAWSSCA